MRGVIHPRAHRVDHYLFRWIRGEEGEQLGWEGPGTPRLICMTEEVWSTLQGRTESSGQEDFDAETQTMG